MHAAVPADESADGHRDLSFLGRFIGSRGVRAGVGQQCRRYARMPLHEEAGALSERENHRQQQHLRDDQLPVRGVQQRVYGADLDQRLRRAGQHQHRDGKHGPVRPHRQDRAELADIRPAQEERREHDQAAEPDAHARQVRDVGDRGQRCDVRGARMAGERPGADTDRRRAPPAGCAPSSYPCRPAPAVAGSP